MELNEMWTQRARDVVVLVADGNSNEQIAKELGISFQTVKWHIKWLSQRVGARNRANLVALAYHHGILQPGVMRLF